MCFLIQAVQLSSSVGFLGGRQEGWADRQLWWRWEVHACAALPGSFTAYGRVSLFPQNPVPESFLDRLALRARPSGQVVPGLFAAESPVLGVTNTAGCLWDELMPSTEPLPQN